MTKIDKSRISIRRNPYGGWYTYIDNHEIHYGITVSPAYNLNKYRNFVYDQGQLGSCTANAFCACFRILSSFQNENVDFEPSRLYLYYHERLIEGNVSSDSGAEATDIDCSRFLEIVID